MIVIIDVPKVEINKKGGVVYIEDRVHKLKNVLVVITSTVINYVNFNMFDERLNLTTIKIFHQEVKIGNKGKVLRISISKTNS